MSKTYQLKARKWKTIGVWFGMPVARKLCWRVDTNRRCSWRRIAGIPGWGRFNGGNCKWIWEGAIQVKSPVDTTVESFFDS